MKSDISTHFGYFYTGNLLLTTLFDVGWIIYCIRECWRVAMKYKTCKKMPDLHPIYRDIQYLSRQRKLYNLKTHFVKYVLMGMCLSVEMHANIWSISFIVSLSEVLTPELKNEWISILSKYPHCHLPYQVAHLVFSPFYILMYTFSYFQLFLLFILLSILTRYLAARYLNHSFKRTLLKYIFWLAVQFILVSLSSTIYTLVFSVLLFPLLILINWLVLLRDNRILSRVLKSNLREIELHSNNKVLYSEQQSAYRFYRIFQKILLLSLFLFVIATFLVNLYVFLIAGRSICIVNIVWGINSTLPNIMKIFPSVNSTLDNSELIIGDMFGLLYTLSTSLPIVCVTFIPLVRACVRRYNSRHNVYRYNYENIKQALMT